MHINHRAMRIMAMAACASGAASAASAQNAEVTDVLQEVTVTATKTGAVGVQAAPFTIQAIGEDALTQGQMQGFDDYAKLVPGLASLNKGPDQTQIMIRGITAGRVSHAEPQNQSTSGLYIDEMPVADNAFNPDLDLFDVNRIEVLKGPQGTLYGAGVGDDRYRLTGRTLASRCAPLLRQAGRNNGNLAACRRSAGITSRPIQLCRRHCISRRVNSRRPAPTKWVGRRALQRTMCVALAADKVLSVFVLTPDCEHVHVEGSL